MGQMRPPCKRDGVLCPSFEPGCRGSCPAYKRWHEEHLKAKALADSMRAAIRDVDELLAGAAMRTLKSKRRR